MRWGKQAVGRGLRLCVAGLFALALVHQSTVARAESNAAPTALLLLKSSSPQGNEVSFGSGATSVGAAARAIRESFESAGIRFVSAAGMTPSLGEAPSGLPLSDSAALEMASKAGAQICVVVGITVVAKGKIRATQLVSHQARLRIRVLDAQSGQAVTDTTTKRYGYASALAPSSTAAVASAISAIGAAFRKGWQERWKAPSAQAASALTLTIRGAQGWRPIASVLKQLAASKGVRFVHALEIDASQVRLSVSTTLSTASLVASLRRTRLLGATLSVVNSGDSITMTVQTNAPRAVMNNG